MVQLEMAAERLLERCKATEAMPGAGLHIFFEPDSPLSDKMFLTQCFSGRKIAFVTA